MAPAVSSHSTRAVAPDWRDPSAYSFTWQLSRERWAWEFLRRNPQYIADWEWFCATWQALEAAYGSPPDRDFLRWKRDPRAYRMEFDSSEDHPDTGDDRDTELLLIECWMGAKWGFHKFPLDPAVDAPVIGEQLAWRPVPQPARVLDPSAMEYLRSDPEVESGKLGLGFDLSLPLNSLLKNTRFLLNHDSGTSNC
ncbi:MAG: transcriptional regulator domain-containing protein [Acidiferrobacterales bacterium]